MANSNSQTVGDMNREFFDSAAPTFSNLPWVRDLVDQITQFLRDNVEWIGLEKDGNHSKGPVRMLDYACGNGTASVALSPFVSTLRGIDISSGMVEQYNTIAKKHGFSEQQMYAIQGDLVASDVEDLSSLPLSRSEFLEFHIIIVSMALHHITDPQKLIEKLSARLANGGVVVIVDWVSPGKTGHAIHISEHGHKLPGAHTVTHNGFASREMFDILAGAGLGDVGVLLNPQKSKVPQEMGGEQQLFLAKGKKFSK